MLYTVEVSLQSFLQYKKEWRETKEFTSYNEAIKFVYSRILLSHIGNYKKSPLLRLKILKVLDDHSYENVLDLIKSAKNIVEWPDIMTFIETEIYKKNDDIIFITEED